jgi:hypothetical protein
MAESTIHLSLSTLIACSTNLISFTEQFAFKEQLTLGIHFIVLLLPAKGGV